MCQKTHFYVELATLQGHDHVYWTWSHPAGTDNADYNPCSLIDDALSSFGIRAQEMPLLQAVCTNY